jgi:hypothetical protein
MKAHATDLADLKSEIDILLREPDVRGANGELIGCRDRLFGALLPDISHARHRQTVTRMFNEFIKGVTCFQGETPYNPNQPMYHRTSACSSRGSPNPECVPENSEDHQKEKEAALRKCYVERQVYDDVWTRIMHVNQDIAHIQWLVDTEKAYRTCKPKSVLRAQVGFDELTNVPYRLDVFEFDDGKLSVQEAYVKSADNTVSCWKTEADGRLQTKSSTFADPGTWTQSGGGNKRVRRNINARTRPKK